ncbi:MAG: SRPBCC domain-containing protein [Cytophagales bacterium]|nr:SRPBCC domain-containing protein [Cytophagales bacterium]
MLKPSLVWVSLLLAVSSCYSLKKRIETGEPYNDQINWPKEASPSEVDFYIHNRIEVEARPEEVWNLLIQAESWSEWYEGMQNVEVLNDENGMIRSASQLKFHTMNRDFDAQVIEYIPNERLTWETNHPKLHAVHSWLIVQNENGCLLITDETQTGTLAKLQKVFLPNKLQKLHDIWLGGFKEKLENQSNKLSAK